jgi:hypothetical protein
MSIPFISGAPVPPRRGRSRYPRCAHVCVNVNVCVECECEWGNLTIHMTVKCGFTSGAYLRKKRVSQPIDGQIKCFPM